MRIIGLFLRRHLRPVHGTALASRIFFGWLLASVCAQAAPVTTHPRLLFRAEDLPGLRARMVPGNDEWVAFKEQVVDKCLVTGSAPASVNSRRTCSIFRPIPARGWS